MEQYPDIKGTADFLVSPIMQTGMKEDIKRVHGLSRTKDLFIFDEGLADKQAPFIYIVRPLVSTLQALEPTKMDIDGDEPSGPDRDHIKALIEDAIVLLGNAHCRLNNWRKKSFAEYLTDVDKRTLKDQIPADKYLFPEQFHNVIKEEHVHANTNRKLVAQSTKPQRGRFQINKSFRDQPFRDQPFRDQSFQRSSFTRPQHNKSFRKSPNNNKPYWAKRGNHAKRS